MDHQEIFAIAHMLQTAKGQIPSEEFAQGFLQGIHYMEILNEIRVQENRKEPATDVATAKALAKLKQMSSLTDDLGKSPYKPGPPRPRPIEDAGI